MKAIFAAIGILSLAAVASPAAAASLIGDSITCTSISDMACPAASANVTANGVEFTHAALGLTYDFTAQALTISNTLSGGHGFGGTASNFVLAFADTTNAFTSASLGPVSSVTGISAQTFSLTNGVLRVGLGGLTLSKGGSFTIGLGTAAATPAVPEPATWALMILGMGAVGFAMRRRSKVNTTVRFA